MAKKARQVFSDIEIEYGRKYGIMPDYHHTQLLQKGVNSDTAAYLINTRMALIWKRMKYEYEHQEEVAKKREEEKRAALMKQLEKECPF